jgi:branched-chain amino acid transport system permease protein
MPLITKLGRSLPRLTQQMSFKQKVVIVLLVVAVILPFALRNQEYYINIFIMIFLMGYLGTAWGLVGQSGQLSFGHSALFGIGAYASTVIFRETGITPFMGMWLGVALAAGFGLIVGYPTLRLRGAYFSLATLAFAYIDVVRTIRDSWFSWGWNSISKRWRCPDLLPIPQ